MATVIDAFNAACDQLEKLRAENTILKTELKKLRAKMYPCSTPVNLDFIS